MGYLMAVSVFLQTAFDGQYYINYNTVSLYILLSIVLIKKTLIV